jgi:exosortase
VTGRGGEPAAGADQGQGLAGLLGLAVVLGLPVLATLPQWRVLGGLWHGELAYAHGWLIVLVCLYLCAEVAGRLRPAATPGPLHVGALGLAALAYLVADFAHVEIVQQLLLPVLMLGFAAVVYGRNGLRLLAFPVLFLGFAIPVWDFLVPVLQRFTVFANGLMLPLAGVPATIDGDLVRVPAGLFEVAGGCSGEHFFVVALSIGSLYAYLRNDGPGRTVAAVALAVVLALVTNWLRVFVIIVRGNQTLMQTSLIRDHYWFGWWLFAAALAAYFLLMHRLNPRPLPAPPPRRAPPGPHPLPVLAGAAALLLPLGWGAVHARGYDRLPPPALAVPSSTDGFAGPLLADVDFRPVFPGALAERLATYQGPAGRIAFYQVAYGRQAHGRKLVGFGASVVPQDWKLRAERVEPLGGLGVVRWLEVERPDRQRLLIASWYVVGGHELGSARSVKLAEAAQAFTAVTHSRLLAIAAPCEPDCDAAAASVRTFAAILPGQR